MLLTALQFLLNHRVLPAYTHPGDLNMLKKYHYACSTKETCLQYSQEILKRNLY